MRTARFTPLLALAFVVAPTPNASTLTVTITNAGASTSAIRVIANAGTVTSGGRTYSVGRDTLRVTGPVELSTTDPVFAATFLADTPGTRLDVKIRENGTPGVSGSGEAVIVIRTPVEGVSLQAMAASVLQRAH